VGQPTGIDLKGEAIGELRTPESTRQQGRRWYSADGVVLGIGQGPVTTTPLQAVRWMSGIATGQMVTPRLGLSFANGDGTQTAVSTPPPVPLSFSAALGPLREGLRQVVADGTAAVLKDLPAPVMAKTGTAEDPLSPGGKTDAWIIAAAPADDPAIAVASFVRGGGHGGETSGPVAQAALRYFLEHRNDVVATAPVEPPPAPGTPPPDS
jgi:cell division protein FtsI/penicillin-binding protein 2